MRVVPFIRKLVQLMTGEELQFNVLAEETNDICLTVKLISLTEKVLILFLVCGGIKFLGNIKNPANTKTLSVYWK